MDKIKKEANDIRKLFKILEEKSEDFNNDEFKEYLDQAEEKWKKIMLDIK